MGQAERYFDTDEDLSNRIVYKKIWMRPPGLNADIAPALTGNDAADAAEMLVANIVDREFELLGTNAVSSCATISQTGGCTITTLTGATDGCIILPHLDAGQSAWSTTKWDTAKSPTLETKILTGASVATCVIAFGFKLTNTSVIATDDDSIYFRYAAADNFGQWQFNVSRAGVDETYNVPTDIVAAVAAATSYKLRIEVYADRTCMGFINDRPIRATPFAAVTSLTTLIPYTILLNASANAKAITSRYITASRLY